MLKKIWLIARREYLERVRTRAFLISTLLIPAALYGMIVLSGKRAGASGAGTRQIVVVAADPSLVGLIQQRLDANGAPSQNPASGLKQPEAIRFQLTGDSDTSSQERDKLRQQVAGSQIDGYMWLTPDAIATGKVMYLSRHASDFIETTQLERAVSGALSRRRLMEAGVRAGELDAALKPVQFETTKLEGGKETSLNQDTAVIAAVVVVMLLFVTVTMYGVMVLRAVVDDKSSRVVEVMLASASSQELMAGKVAGVGAVGLTQMLVWGIAAAIFSTPGIIAASSMGVSVPMRVLVSLPCFFVLGYLLYSVCFAALGASVNSEQEAQQLQMIVMLPLILSSTFMWDVIRHPDSAQALALSMFPFTSPIIMFVRLAVSAPPWWQLLLCVVILVFTIGGLLWLCGRIYRVGILMYGKRPTFGELMKWVRYS